MPIRTGDAVPPFTLPARPGEDVDLGAHLGRDVVVLLFFPLAFSPTCTTEMCTFRDDWSAWADLEARVFGICPDNPFVTAKFRDDLDIPFPILADFNRDVSQRFDVLHEDLFGLRDVPKRSVFVIGRDGHVAWSWVSDDPGAEPDYAGVRAAVEAAGSA